MSEFIEIVKEIDRNHIMIRLDSLFQLTEHKSKVAREPFIVAPKDQEYKLKLIQPIRADSPIEYEVNSPILIYDDKEEVLEKIHCFNLFSVNLLGKVQRFFYNARFKGIDDISEKADWIYQLQKKQN